MSREIEKMSGEDVAPISLEIFDVLKKYELSPAKMLIVLVGLIKSIELGTGIKVADFHMLEQVKDENVN